MKATLSKLAIAILALTLGLGVARQVWSVGSASQLWQVGDWWTVSVQRVQVFVAEPSPPWSEANRIRFEVRGITQGLEGTRVQMCLTFARPVLDGYQRLELTYDGRSLAPVSGRLIGDGLADLDWGAAKPLLEASLIPLEGLRWRQVTDEKIRYQAQGWNQDITAYRVLLDKAEYGWAVEAPWWLWYKAGDQVQAELVECSCWQPGAAALPPFLPWPEAPTPSAVSAPAQAQVLDYQLVLKEDNAGEFATVARRSGALAFEKGLGTQVISVLWGSPQHKMYIYISLSSDPDQQVVSIGKVAITEPIYAVRDEKASAAFADGHAALETHIMVGKTPYLLGIECSLH